MLNDLKTNPSVKLNRNIMILGLLIFVPIYTIIFQLFGKMGIETSEFNRVWLSFDPKTFQTFFKNVENMGQLETFLWTFNLNLISMTGFMLVFFSLSLMLARQIPGSSRLAGSAFIFPLLAIGIGLLDIIPTLVFLIASSSIPTLSKVVIYTISGGYVIRVVLLYALLIWMIISGITILRNRFKKAKV